MTKEHIYELALYWTGNKGSGTQSYTGYGREYQISAIGKSVFQGSSDPDFRGDPALYNPEEFLVSSLAACHMLWYLHLCASAGVVVVSYTDTPSGTMLEDVSGKGRFTEVKLFPKTVVQDQEMILRALELHQKAHDYCFIARSVNFPVTIQPVCMSREDSDRQTETEVKG